MSLILNTVVLNIFNELHWILKPLSLKIKFMYFAQKDFILRTTQSPMFPLLPFKHSTKACTFQTSLVSIIKLWYSRRVMCYVTFYYFEVINKKMDGFNQNQTVLSYSEKTLPNYLVCVRAKIKFTNTVK